MKLIIEHSETKREVNGALNICGRYEDLMWLAESIYNKIKDDKKYHGWITIAEKRPIEQKINTDSPAIKWD